MSQSWRSRVATTLVGTALALVLLAGTAFAHSTFGARLNGETEVPGPGDPDGHGFATLIIDGRAGTVCWSLAVRKITLPATAAHIHEGDRGVSGDVVVTLSPPDATGHSSGCTLADPDLLKAIKGSWGHYYVNVHNTDYPAGAVRGQLHFSGV